MPKRKNEYQYFSPLEKYMPPDGTQCAILTPQILHRHAFGSLFFLVCVSIWGSILLILKEIIDICCT